jgi:hypothetical protein
MASRAAKACSASIPGSAPRNDDFESIIEMAIRKKRNAGSSPIRSDRFDDPNLPGQMRTTIVLKPVSVGTDVSIEQGGIPDAIPVEMCYLGWPESLTLLAQLVQAEVPD